MNKVLLIDDEPDIHEILDVHLKRKGIDVEHALTGEGFEFVRGKRHRRHRTPQRRQGEED